MKSLRTRYEEVCAAYATAFCEACEFDETEIHWIGGTIGGVLEISDYSFGFGDVVYCVDNSVAWDDLYAWYDYGIDAGTLGFAAPNLVSWLAGCPRKSESEIAEIRAMHAKIAEIRSEIEKLCKQ